MPTDSIRDIDHIQSTAGSKARRSLYAGLQPDGYIKIGMSRTPKTRVRSLGLRLIHYTAPCLWPHVAERIAHGVLKCYGRHVSGETFRVTAMQAATIIDGAVESVTAAQSAASWAGVSVDLEISHLPRPYSSRRRRCCAGHAKGAARRASSHPCLSRRWVLSIPSSSRHSRSIWRQEDTRVDCCRESAP